MSSPNGKSYARIDGQYPSEQFQIEPSLKDTPHPRGSSWKRNVNRLWLFEWLGWLIAVAAIAGIVIELYIFNGQPVPEWRFGITLATLVSILATIAIIGLSEPVTSCIGQSRWLWFSRDRRMADFSAIDDASRGVYGSLKLILRFRGGIFSIIGAFLVILMQFIAPFVQQVVHYDTRSVNSSAAAVPISQIYDTRGTDGRDVSLSMKAAMQRGILDTTANTSTFFVSPQCPTGNCTWAPYTSLSVCSRCADLSHHLTTTNVTDLDNTYLVSLPNNVSMQYTPGLTSQGFIYMTSATTSYDVDLLIDSIAYKEWSGAILDVFTLVTPYDNAGSSGTGTPFGPYASECVLQFCVQKYQSSSFNGTYTESAIGDPIYLDNPSGDATVTDNSTGLNYTLDYYTYQAANMYLEDLFTNVIEQHNGLSTSVRWNSSVSQSLFYWINETNDHMPTRLFNNLAASMSLNVRGTSTNSSEGVAQSVQSIVIVEWAWMTLPFLALIFVGIYLLIISWTSSSRHVEPWKTNSLAILMHGFADPDSRIMVSGAQRVDEMETIAKGLTLTTYLQAEDGKFNNGHTYMAAR